MDGCITNNPLFVDGINSNFQLQALSPCIDAGNNTYAPTNATPYDLAGNPRIMYGTVDMGAYEWLKRDQTITFPAIPNHNVEDTVVLSATASSGLPVSFAVADGPAVLAGGNTLSFNGVGTVSVRASQAGNADWNAAPDITRSFSVTESVQPPAGVSGSMGDYLDKVRVTWTASAGATGYQVWRSYENNSATALQIAVSDATSYDDTTVAAGNTYYYWVKAVNAGGTSVYSSVAIGYPGVVGPLVSINGMIGENARVASGAPVTITVEIMNLPPAYIGYEVDYWVAAFMHSGGLWFYLNSDMIFTPFDGDLDNMHPAYQGPLADLPPCPIARDITLGAGTYNVWFAVTYPCTGRFELISGQYLMSRVTLVVE